MTHARTILFSILVASAGALQAVQVGHPDLVVTAVRINPDGVFVFTMANRGDAAVGTPFKVDAYLDGYLRQTVQFDAKGDIATIGRSVLPRRLPVAPGEQRNFVLPDVKVDLCSAPHSLKVVVDSGAVIPERDESNNELTWSGATPCPDLAVKSIHRNYNHAHTEYNAEIVVINQGTGTAKSFSIAAGAASTTGIPSGAPIQYERLGAGETMTIHAGHAFSFESMSVHVVLDVGNLIKELDETNNVANKNL